MSNYTKSTNFAAKDSLPSGNANKVVKGTEINTEFDNIATAITSKADLNSPTLVTPNLGTPSAAVLTNATGLPLTTGVTGTLPVANGGTGATTFSAGALLKGAGTSAITTATAGTDYAPATSGTSILKGNGSGGFSSVVSGTDIKTINSTSLLGSGDIAITLTPGGSNTQVQYNNAGAFGGSANFVFDGTNVGIGTSSPAVKLDISETSSGAVVTQAFLRNPAALAANTAVRLSMSAVNTANRFAYIQAGVTGASDNGHYLAFGTNELGTGPVERARFNATGAFVLAGGTTTANGIGITFPATQSASSDANTLDDYEEGTWTPTIEGSSTVGTASYTVQNGRYTKIGRVVQFECYVAYSGGTGSGSLRVSGLPFTTASGSTYPAVSCTTENIAMSANNYACPYVANSSTFIYMASNPTGGGTRNLIAYDAAGEIMLAGTYSI